MTASSMAEVCSTRKKRRIGLRMLSELKITLGLIINKAIPTSNCKCAKYTVSLAKSRPVLPNPSFFDNPDNGQNDRAKKSGKQKPSDN